MLNLKKDFPILSRKVNGKPLVYLDSAATSQKPRQVIDSIKEFYEMSNANVARGVHTLAEEATDKYEKARDKVAHFIGAKPQEVIFVRNASEAINLVACSYGSTMKKGERIVSTVMEHHSNIVPWQMLKQRQGTGLDFVDVTDDGRLKIGDFEKFKLSKIFAVSHASNVLGTINNIKAVSDMAHKHDGIVLVDGAQSVPHMPVDVKKLDADFFAFSGHKMCGPSGIGVLYGKAELLEKMPPFLGGGDMIKEVKLEHTKYNDIPWKFEAGTPNISGAIGLGAAIDYLNSKGMGKIRKHEIELTKYALDQIESIDGIRIFGNCKGEERGGVISFDMRGIHPHDIASLLDRECIAVRSGHACAQPLMERLGVKSITRASFYLYNEKPDVDALVVALQNVKKLFKV